MNEVKESLVFSVQNDENLRFSPEIHTQHGEVAIVETGQQENNQKMAEFIARACNNYYKLVEALQLAVEHLNRTDATHDRTGRRVDTTAIRNNLRAALADVE